MENDAPVTRSVQERIKSYLAGKKQVLSFIGLIIFAAVNILVAGHINKPLRFESQASVHNVTLSLQPGKLVVPESGNVQLWVHPDSGVAFIHVELNYDQNKIQVQNIFPPEPPVLFNRQVDVSDLNTANRTGKLVYAVGLDPLQRQNPPSTSFHLATFKFIPVVQDYATSEITFNQSGLQLVDSEAHEMEIKAEGATVEINPGQFTGSPTPASVNSTITPAVTSAPVMTATSVPVQTIFPEPSFTPAPTQQSEIIPGTTSAACLPVDGAWVYGDWSACTLECGSGVQFRTATCQGAVCGGTCNEDAVTRRKCNTQSCASIITVYAAGTGAAGIYPVMQILVDGQVVAQWSNIKGNPNRRQFGAYIYQSPVKLTVDRLKVRFINDANIGREDRNLRIDKLVIDGKTYQAESRLTYSTGTWTKRKGCAAGYMRSEWLNCNGYMVFK